MEIFKLFGSIFVNTDAADESMKKTEKKADSIASKLGTGIKTAAKWGTAIVTGATIAATAMVGLATDAAGTADEIDKMSQKIGISNEAYQEWSYVMGQNGMDVEKLSVGMKTLVSQMDMAASGTASAQENFDKLGISIYDSAGKLKDQETILNEAMHALADMENGTEKARLATELFGKAGIEMMPMLNQGSDAMDELTKRAHDLGLVMSDEAVSAGVTLGDTIDDIKQSFSMIGTNLGVAVIPVIQQFADLIINNMPLIQESIGALAPILVSLTSTILPVISDLAQTLLPIVLDLISQAIPIIEFLAQVLTATLGAAMKGLAPVIDGIMQAFGGLLDFITGVFTGDWEKMGEGLLEIVTGLWNGITSIFDSLVGFLGDSFEKITDYAKENWSEIAENTEKAWSVVKRVASEKMSEARAAIEKHGGGIKGFFGAMGETLQKNWTNTFNRMNQASGGKLGEMLTSARSKLEGIKSAFVDKLGSARDFVGNAINKIKSFFNFNWSLPDLKMPHFSISGEFSLNPLSVPSIGIDWYAKAMDDPMIMDSPTAFGINSLGQIMAGGEKGSEVVSGTDTLMNLISEAVAAKNARLEEILMKILAFIMEYMPQLANMKMVTDTGALIGELAPGMDEALGHIAYLKEKGVL